MQDVQFDAVELVQAACAKEGIALSNASLRWLIHHSQLSASKGDAVIIGASKLSHYQSNIIPFLVDEAKEPTSCEAKEKGKLPVSIVEAFDRAWELIRNAGACPPYSRGVSKW